MSLTSQPGRNVVWDVTDADIVAQTCFQHITLYYGQLVISDATYI